MGTDKDFVASRFLASNPLERWLSRHDLLNFYDDLAIKTFILKFLQVSYKPAMLWLALSTVLLCLPGSALPKNTWFDLIWLDKWVHLFMFAIMVILWSYPYPSRSNRKIQQCYFFLITTLSIVYAVMMEFVQLNFIAFRSFDVLDIIAGTVGSFSGWIFMLKFTKK